MTRDVSQSCGDKLNQMKSHFRQFLCFCVLVFLPCSSLLAHSDTTVRLEHKKLVGLPKQYTPAELDVNAFRLKIKDHEMEFSPLLKSFFDLPHDLTLSASWYHESDILPPYLLLHILPKKKDFSFQLLINLDTLDLIEASVVLRNS